MSVSESSAQELESSMKVLTKVDLDLAYSAEKLANLQELMMRLFSQENDLEAMATANNYIMRNYCDSDFSRFCFKKFVISLSIRPMLWYMVLIENLAVFFLLVLVFVCIFVKSEEYSYDFRNQAFFDLH
ncbi:hypothetical protein RchiOBHm_Chr1g0319921 [Rosa chinensis]|uniref:WIT1/2 N-terminal helical bundle domain-containing protein n=1 Tax=Rosa chinensis TaxID=74649 RepID=A0A2P6S8L3_ROSCH|nr:hypothetical protein RchiOBHm_Chr1g0319921 [Rosa chinensis]